MPRIVIASSGGKSILLDAGTPIGQLPDGRYTLKSVESGEAVQLRGQSFNWRQIGMGAIAAAAVGLITRLPSTGGMSIAGIQGGDPRIQTLWRQCGINATGFTEAQLRLAESNCRRGQ